MDPDRSWTRHWKLGQRWKREPQALFQIGQILAIAQTQHQPVRREQKSCVAHQQAINEIHYAWLRFVCAPPAGGRATQGNPAYPLGIEGVKMRKVYYTPARKLTLFLLVLVVLPCVADKAHAQQTASLKTSALESHEGLTISALPWSNPAQYKEKFHRKSPYAAGIVALQVTFRNDSDDSLKVSLERIRLNLTLSEDNRQALNPLNAEQAADVIMKPGAKNVTRSRFPPIGGPKVGRDKKWIEVEEELREAGVRASIVAPHSSVQGLLYFDVQSQFDLLSSARLYIPEIVALEKNRGLMYFEIDLTQFTQR